MPIGYLNRVICEVRESNGFPDDIVISEECVQQRSKKKSLFVVCASPETLSPLHDCEMEFLQVLIQMSKIRQSQSPTESLTLINSMIAGTKTQRDLILFKMKYSFGNTGAVGDGYWKGFKKRHGHLISSKRGAKYELDRYKWTTHANVSDMYNHICDEMVDVDLGHIYNYPRWHDLSGDDCDEDNAFGYKVIHDAITHPEMCVVMDEIGGNEMNTSGVSY